MPDDELDDPWYGEEDSEPDNTLACGVCDSPYCGSVCDTVGTWSDSETAESTKDIGTE